MTTTRDVPGRRAPDGDTTRPTPPEDPLHHAARDLRAAVTARRDGGTADLAAFAVAGMLDAVGHALHRGGTLPAELVESARRTAQYVLAHEHSHHVEVTARTRS